jgi:hypothetical protein
MEIMLTKKQVGYILEKSGEKTPKKAFRMFVSAMKKENISLTKMALLIDKMIAQDKKEKKE